MRNLFVFLMVVFMCLFFITPAMAGQKTLQFEWQQNDIDLSSLTGWRLFMSEMSNNYDMNTPFDTILYNGTPMTQYESDQIVTVPDGSVVTKFFKLNAYNPAGVSGLSNEVFVIIDFTVPPSSPFGLTVTIISS